MCQSEESINEGKKNAARTDDGTNQTTFLLLFGKDD
jgi:hypothetical protein